MPGLPLDRPVTVCLSTQFRDAVQFSPNLDHRNLRFGFAEIGPTLCPAVMAKGSYSNLWIYLVGPLTGGALAAGAYRLQHADEMS